VEAAALEHVILADFDAAFEQVRPSVAASELAELTAFNERFGSHV